MITKSSNSHSKPSFEESRVSSTHINHQWHRKRKHTFIAFCIQNFLAGIEYSLTFLTLWLYLNDLVKPELPKIYYGLISAAYLLSSVLCSFYVGRFVDRTHKTRLVFFIGNTLVVIGNVIYTLHFSPFLLLIGRLLSGAGGPLRSVIVGEIARIYEEDEISIKISYVGMFYSFGFLIGPVINFAFTNIDIRLGFWRINYTNVVGLNAAVLFAVMLVITYFMIFDLSKEHNLKKCREEENSHKVFIHYSSDCEKRPILTSNFSKKRLIKKLFRNKDTLTLILASFASNYLMVSIDNWTPLLVIDVMGWTISELNIVVLGTGISSVIALLIVVWRKPSDATLYICAMTAAIVYVIIQLIFMILPIYHSNRAFNICMCIIFTLGYAFASLIEDVFLVSCLAKLVPSEIQTFTDTVRMSMLRGGGLIGLLTSAVLFDWVTTVGAIHVIIILCGAFCFSLRRKSLINPKVQIC